MMIVLPACALLTAVVASTGEVRPWMNTQDTPEARAHKLVAEMTTTEKVSIYSGGGGCDRAV